MTAPSSRGSHCVSAIHGRSSRTLGQARGPELPPVPREVRERLLVRSEVELVLVVLLEEVLVGEVRDLSLEVEPLENLLLVPPAGAAAEVGRHRLRAAVAAEDVDALVVDAVELDHPLGPAHAGRRTAGSL